MRKAKPGKTTRIMEDGKLRALRKTGPQEQNLRSNVLAKQEPLQLQLEHYQTYEHSEWELTIYDERDAKYILIAETPAQLFSALGTLLK